MLLLRVLSLIAVVSVCLAAKRTEWPDGLKYTGGLGDESGDASDQSGDNNGSEESSTGGDEDADPDAPITSEAQAIVVKQSQTSSSLKNVLDVVLDSRDIGTYAHLSEQFLLTIPAETLASLRPEVLASLPPSVQARAAVIATQKGKSTAQLLSALGPEKFSALPWDVLITQLSPETMNVMGPSQITSIPWDSAMPNMPPTLMKGMSARALYYIPASSWQLVSQETFLQIEPRALGQLEVASLRSIPRGHYDALSPEVLNAIPKDKLIAIDPQLLLIASGQGSAGGFGAGGSGGAGAEGVDDGEEEADGGCDDLTLGELTQQVSTGQLSYPCRLRFRRLTRQRVFMRSFN